MYVIGDCCVCFLCGASSQGLCMLDGYEGCVMYYLYCTFAAACTQTGNSVEFGIIRNTSCNSLGQYVININM